MASITGLSCRAVRTRVQTYFEQEHHHEPESSLVFIGYHPRRERSRSFDEGTNRFGMEIEEMPKEISALL